MKIPVIQGLIERRILVNYRVAPEYLSRILPTPFEPKLVRGWGIAGICLIRLSEIRPRGVPAFLGVSSENAAHRIAVQWREQGQLLEGVYIPRRDTSSRLNTWLGGRLFPGAHQHARFEVNESVDHVEIAMRSYDGAAHVVVRGHEERQLSAHSIFESVQDVSEFFRSGSLGYSPTPGNRAYDGLELRSFNWHVQPFEIERVESSFFEDAARFPPGSVKLDCGLLMRGIDHEWHGRGTLSATCCDRPAFSCGIRGIASLFADYPSGFFVHIFLY